MHVSIINSFCIILLQWKYFSCTKPVLLSPELEAYNKDGRKLFMSALSEEAVVCNYRCFSSPVANTTNKCSCVTWQRVSENPFVSKLVCLCSCDHMTKAPYSFLPLFLSPPCFLGASSAFEVAMWKSLATNPNKYNNRAINSLSQRSSAVFLFFLSLSLLGWCSIL